MAKLLINAVHHSKYFVSNICPVCPCEAVAVAPSSLPSLDFKVIFLVAHLNGWLIRLDTAIFPILKRDWALFLLPQLPDVATCC